MYAFNVFRLPVGYIVWDSYLTLKILLDWKFKKRQMVVIYFSFLKSFLFYIACFMHLFVQVLRPGSVPPNTRDNLYQGLPPTVKSGLRNRLQYTHNRNEVSNFSG